MVPPYTRPSLWPRSSVNHAAPSGATARAVSPALGVGTVSSSNRPLAKRPILLAAISRNQTAPLVSTATSPRPLTRVGTSNAVLSPLGEIRKSLLAFCSVAHTVPSRATVTPNGAASIGVAGVIDPRT